MYKSKGDNVNRTLVALTLANDTILTVSMRLPLSNKIQDALNSAEAFLDVLTPNGEQLFIAKADIRAVRSMDLPRADQIDLPSRAAGLAAVDPHEVLKIGNGASEEEVRQAYHRMVRLYHPDRIASYDLPEEMKEYARAMLVRINLAFEQIRS